MPITKFRMVGPHQTPVDNDEYIRLVTQDRALQKLFVGNNSLGQIMEETVRMYRDGKSTDYYMGKLDGMRLVIDMFEKARKEKPKNDLPF